MYHKELLLSTSFTARMDINNCIISIRQTEPLVLSNPVKKLVTTNCYDLELLIRDNISFEVKGTVKNIYLDYNKMTKRPVKIKYMRV